MAAEPIKTNRLVVRLRAWTPELIPSLCAAANGVEAGTRVPALRLLSISVPPGTEVQAREAVSTLPGVEGCFVDVRVRPVAYMAASDDTLLDSQWQLKTHGILRAWKFGTGVAAVGVGAVDSGTLPHPDLKTPDLGHNTTYNTPSPLDTCFSINNNYSHGQSVHTQFAALRNNATGFSGICPDCSVGCIATGDELLEGYPTGYDVIAGNIMLVDYGYRIISSSTIGYPCIPPQDPVTGGFSHAANAEMEAWFQAWWDMYRYVWDNGAIFFQAAGNLAEDWDYTTGPVSYTHWPHILPVTAIDSSENRSVWGGGSSGYGSEVLFGCSGTGVSCIDNGHNYGTSGTDYNYYNGTSFAAPTAAAIAALIWSANPLLTRAQVLDIMYETGRVPRGNLRSTCPNAVIPDAGRGVARALSTLAANAGVPFPHVGFAGTGVATVVSGGVATTTLNGDVRIDLAGFVDGGNVEAVELWLGGTKLYDGPPAQLSGTASSSGTAQAIKIVAKHGAATAEETFSDVVIASVTISEIVVNDFADVSAGVAFSSETSAADLTSITRGAMAGRSWIAGPPSLLDSMDDRTDLRESLRILSNAAFSAAWSDAVAQMLSAGFGSASAFVATWSAAETLAKHLGFSGSNAYAVGERVNAEAFVHALGFQSVADFTSGWSVATGIAQRLGFSGLSAFLASWDEALALAESLGLTSGAEYWGAGEGELRLRLAAAFSGNADFRAANDTAVIAEIYERTTARSVYSRSAATNMAERTTARYVYERSDA